MGGEGTADPGIERELKLDLDVGAALPALDDLPGVAEVAPLDDQALDATYWDTAAGDLLALGATLRRRTGEGAAARWTLKLPVVEAPGGVVAAQALARTEVELDDEAQDPPAALIERVRSVVAGPLAPVARLRSARRRLALRDGRGDLLAEVDDDVVTADVPGRPPLAFREVEVELGPGGAPALLVAVADRLRAAGATTADPRPKLARALAGEADRAEVR